ncbi:MAG: type I-B CRISPR-associated protein Cas7/Csh2, partial [Spirochaetota bacterium]
MNINKSEILFLYDITDANPNGDPNDENKPRIDEETGINIVTDVRLKRTIRDYFYDYKGYNGENGKDIFVRTTYSDEKSGSIKTGDQRAKDFGKDKEKIKENVLSQCLDMRLFGGVIPLGNDSIKFTGPVQFQMGRSLHRVNINFIKGTGAFASKVGSKQQTFREEHILPYSFIAFHGIINPNAGKETGLSQEDVDLLIEGIWEGTKNLISRSKFGQVPRMLLKIDYNDNFFIGDLHRLISINSKKEDEQLRNVKDFKLDISELNSKVDK